MCQGECILIVGHQLYNCPPLRVKFDSDLKMVAVCSSEILIPTHQPTLRFHSEKCQNKKITTNLFTSCPNVLFLRTPLDYNFKRLYITKTDPLLCLKINYIYHTAKLANNIKLLIIWQLPSRTRGHTDNYELWQHRCASIHHSLNCLSVPSINAIIFIHVCKNNTIFCIGSFKLW